MAIRDPGRDTRRKDEEVKRELMAQTRLSGSKARNLVGKVDKYIDTALNESNVRDLRQCNKFITSLRVYKLQKRMGSRVVRCECPRPFDEASASFS